MAVELRKLIKKATHMDISQITGFDKMDSPVSWVQMVECQRAADFLEGGEFVMITGSGLGGKEPLLSVIQAVYEKNAAAVLVNIGPFIGNIPEEVLDFCRQKDFPLFTVPWKVHLSDLMQIFCYEITKDEQKDKETAQAFENAIFFPKEEELYVIPLSLQGFQAEWRYSVCMICLQNSSGKMEDRLKQITMDLKIFARSRYTRFAVFTHNSEILAIAADYTEDEMREFAKDIRNCARNCLLPKETITAGCGCLTKSIRCLYKSYHQADSIQKLQAKGRIDPSRIFYSDMGLFQVLMDVDDQDVIQRYYDRTLSPLKQYDEKNNTNLSLVLRTYLEHDGSVKDTAAVLYTHRNTINYKLSRISEILGRDLSSLNTRLELTVGYLLEDMM